MAWADEMPTMEPPPAGDHVGNGELAGHEVGLDEHVLAAVPVGLGDVHQLVVGMPAGVVDEAVDAAEAVEGSVRTMRWQPAMVPTSAWT